MLSEQHFYAHNTGRPAGKLIKTAHKLLNIEFHENQFSSCSYM
jgi:hypothetical protein